MSAPASAVAKDPTPTPTPTPPPPRALLRRLSPELTPIPLASPLLASRSPLLAQCVRAQKPLHWDPSLRVRKSALEGVVAYCHQPGLGMLSLDEVLDLLEASIQLKVPALQYELEERLSTELNRENFLSIYDLARTVEASQTVRHCLTYLWRYHAQINQTELRRRNLDTVSGVQVVYAKLTPPQGPVPLFGYLRGAMEFPPDVILKNRDQTIAFHKAVLKVLLQGYIKKHSVSPDRSKGDAPGKESPPTLECLRNISWNVFRALQSWAYTGTIRMELTAEEWLELLDLCAEGPGYLALRSYAIQTVMSAPLEAKPQTTRDLANRHHIARWNETYALNWDLYSGATPGLERAACINDETSPTKLAQIASRVAHIYCARIWNLSDSVRFRTLSALTTGFGPPFEQWSRRAHGLQYVSTLQELTREQIEQLLRSNSRLRHLRLIRSDLSTVSGTSLPRLCHTMACQTLPNLKTLHQYTPALETIECGAIDDTDGPHLGRLQQLRVLQTSSIGPETLNACLTRCRNLERLLATDSPKDPAIKGPIVATRLHHLKLLTLNDATFIELIKVCNLHRLELADASRITLWHAAPHLRPT